MVEIDYESIDKLRYQSLFKITVKKMANDIKELFEKHARDYTKNNWYISPEDLSYLPEEQWYLASGKIELTSMDGESCLDVEIDRNQIIINSIEIKHGISRDFLDELVPCIRKCIARLGKYDKIIFERVEDEAIKKWCMDHGYEENVQEWDVAYGGKFYRYSYVLHLGNELQEVEDYWGNIDTRQEMYQALISSKGVKIKELLEGCVCSFLFMEPLSVESLSRETHSSDGDGKENWIGGLAYSSYDAATDIRFSFYTNSIVIHRFRIGKGYIRKCLDECLDQIVEMAKYVVDIESIVFQDIEGNGIRDWCSENGYREDGTTHDMILELSDGPVEEQLHCKDVRFLAAFLSTYINVPEYEFTFYALNHEAEKDISASDLMHELISERIYSRKDFLTHELVTEFGYSKHEFWRIDADRRDISPNEICYDTVDLYRDGNRMDNVAEICHRDGVLRVKLNIDLDMIGILPDGSIHSIDVVDKNNHYLLRVTGDEMVDEMVGERYIGRILYDFRENKFYNESDECKVYQWKAVQ